eukprot:GDKJ01044965.1.p1 GENE.GDKJ01044965.1~~GDKJ01044965.1.p1  ORF type:complete len:1666 (+),score=387.97 GDKJ01044965.1:11-5008(+)
MLKSATLLGVLLKVDASTTELDSFLSEIVRSACGNADTSHLIIERRTHSSWRVRNNLDYSTVFDADDGLSGPFSISYENCHPNLSTDICANLSLCDIPLDQGGPTIDAELVRKLNQKQRQPRLRMNNLKLPNSPLQPSKKDAEYVKEFVDSMITHLDSLQDVDGVHTLVQNFDEEVLSKLLNGLPRSYDPRSSERVAPFGSFKNCVRPENVLDQGACGSCYAYAAATEMTLSVCSKYSFFFRHDENSGAHTYSPKQVFDCNLKSVGDPCLGGPPDVMRKDMKLALHSNYLDGRRCGLNHLYLNLQSCRKSDLNPPSNKPCECVKNAVVDADLKSTCEFPNQSYGTMKKVYNFSSSDTPSFHTVMKAIIYARGAVRSLLRAPEFFIDAVRKNPEFSLGAVYETKANPSADALKKGMHARHAVVAVGWGYAKKASAPEAGEQLYWIFQNSWGSSFADGGFYKVFADDTVIVSEVMWNSLYFSEVVLDADEEALLYSSPSNLVPFLNLPRPVTKLDHRHFIITLENNILYPGYFIECGNAFSCTELKETSETTSRVVHMPNLPTSIPFNLGFFHIQSHYVEDRQRTLDNEGFHGEFGHLVSVRVSDKHDMTWTVHLPTPLFSQDYLFVIREALLLIWPKVFLELQSKGLHLDPRYLGEKEAHFNDIFVDFDYDFICKKLDNTVENYLDKLHERYNDHYIGLQAACEALTRISQQTSFPTSFAAYQSNEDEENQQQNSIIPEAIPVAPADNQIVEVPFTVRLDDSVVFVKRKDADIYDLAFNLLCRDKREHALYLPCSVSRSADRDTYFVMADGYHNIHPDASEMSKSLIIFRHDLSLPSSGLVAFTRSDKKVWIDEVNFKEASSELQIEHGTYSTMHIIKHLAGSADEMTLSQSKPFNIKKACQSFYDINKGAKDLENVFLFCRDYAGLKQNKKERMELEDWGNDQEFQTAKSLCPTHIKLLPNVWNIRGAAIGYEIACGRSVRVNKLNPLNMENYDCSINFEKTDAQPVDHLVNRNFRFLSPSERRFIPKSIQKRLIVIDSPVFNPVLDTDDIESAYPLYVDISAELIMVDENDEDGQIVRQETGCKVIVRLPPHIPSAAAKMTAQNLPFINIFDKCKEEIVDEDWKKVCVALKESVDLFPKKSIFITENDFNDSLEKKHLFAPSTPISTLLQEAKKVLPVSKSSAPSWWWSLSPQADFFSNKDEAVLIRLSGRMHLLRDDLLVVELTAGHMHTEYPFVSVADVQHLKERTCMITRCLMAESRDRATHVYQNCHRAENVDEKIVKALPNAVYIPSSVYADAYKKRPDENVEITTGVSATCSVKTKEDKFELREFFFFFDDDENSGDLLSWKWRDLFSKALHPSLNFRSLCLNTHRVSSLPALTPSVCQRLGLLSQPPVYWPSLDWIPSETDEFQAALQEQFPLLFVTPAGSDTVYIVAHLRVVESSTNVALDNARWRISPVDDRDSWVFSPSTKEEEDHNNEPENTSKVLSLNALSSKFLIPPHYLMPSKVKSRYEMLNNTWKKKNLPLSSTPDMSHYVAFDLDLLVGDTQAKHMSLAVSLQSDENGISVFQTNIVKFAFKPFSQDFANKIKRVFKNMDNFYIDRLQAIPTLVDHAVQFDPVTLCTSNLPIDDQEKLDVFKFFCLSTNVPIKQALQTNVEDETIARS